MDGDDNNGASIVYRNDIDIKTRKPSTHVTVEDLDIADLEMDDLDIEHCERAISPTS